MDHNVDNKLKNVNTMPQDVMPVLNVSEIIEFNPVRADIVTHPGDYRWPGYLYNTGE